MYKVGQLVSNPGGFGGAEKMAVYLSRGLQQKNLYSEIYVLGDDTWTHEQGRKYGFDVITLPDYVQKRWSVKQLPLLAISLGHFLGTRNIDILHSHMYAATVRGAAASKFVNIPHVATQHDNHTIDEKTKSRVKWLNIAGMVGTRFAMISNQMMNYYIDRGLKKQYCHLVYNGVDNEKLKFNNTIRQEVRNQLGILDSEIVLVVAARLEPIKGVDILIKALAPLHNKPFKLIVLGDGSERSKLENMVQMLNLNNKVKFVGTVSNVPDYLFASDVFTLASRNEGLPCSIIEAMFASLPIVTTNVGGNAELVLQGKNGYLVQPENSDILALTLRAVINSGIGRLRDMGAVSYQHAQNFTLSSMTENYMTLYDNVP